MAPYTLDFPAPLKQRVAAMATPSLHEVEDRLKQLAGSPPERPGTSPFLIVRVGECRLMVEIDPAAGIVRVIDVRGPQDP